MKCFVWLFCALSVSAESLHYTINWPSGLSLGEASIDSTHAKTEKGGGNWDFNLDIDASVPGFPVRDDYHSTATGALCSLDLDRKFTHGTHKGEDRVAFDQQAQTATRQTVDGGKSEISLPPCARDALTFLQFARNELAQGRLAPQQPVVLGSVYQVRLEFADTETIKLGDQRVEADRIVATIKGAQSNLTVQIYFSRDTARVPLMAKVPLSLGTFSVELVR